MPAKKRLVETTTSNFPEFVTSQTQINPAPRNMQQMGRGHAALL